MQTRQGAVRPPWTSIVCLRTARPFPLGIDRAAREFLTGSVPGMMLPGGYWAHAAHRVDAVVVAPIAFPE
jgi:hypothetical protein